MAKDGKRTSEGSSGGYNERWLRRKDATKAIRFVLQMMLVAVLVYLMWTLVLFPKQHQTDVETARTGNSFIAVSYCGVTTRDSMDSGIVTRRSFQEQMAALHECGYVTITQQDILDYYQKGTPLPEKAMFLILEDGILNSSTLVQSTLEKYNYQATFCSFAQNMEDANSKYASGADLRRLAKNSYWELGTNGYRLSYINVFDRYGDYFGHLNSDEFSLVSKYLRRDYNHYLMDFLRDEDRLRQETPEQMEARLETDYAQLRQDYEKELGFVPQMYILMHSNSGAFGNDPQVSDKNREQLTGLFAMNFNRQGSCLNTRDSSIYDLTRLQVQPYFSTNHLLMRIQDDIGQPMTFVTGDQEEAANWFQDDGAAEFRDNQIILTTQPYDTGRITLDSALVSDVDLSVTLEGNKVGQQSIYLRTDRNLAGGVQVALECGELVIRDLSDGSRELFRLNLSDFDEQDRTSSQEDQYEALKAYYHAVIRCDEDPQRVEQARQDLQALKKTSPLSVERGGTAYVPELDISERDSRALRIRLVGRQMSVWLDGRTVVENLQLSSDRRGGIALGAGVWKTGEHYSQINIWDDVYDAVFTDLTIRSGESTVLYSNRLTPLQTVQMVLRNGWNDLENFFMECF
ncbi:MAG: glycoside hydrolase [Candidatus Faecousia sp.]|nr:glycoside hydrolase [Candidatus Faecousia sp.]